MVVKRTHRKTQRRRTQHRRTHSRRTHSRRTQRKKRINTKRNKVRRKQRTYKKLKRGGSGRKGSGRTGSGRTGSGSTGSRRTGSRSTGDPISPLAVAFGEVARASKAGDSSLIRAKKKKKKKEDEDRVPGLVPPPAPPPPESVVSAMKLANAALGARLSSESSRTKRADKVQVTRMGDASWQEAAQKAMDEESARILENSKIEGSKMRAQYEAKSAAETEAQRLKRRKARGKAGNDNPEGSIGCCGFKKRSIKVKQPGEAKEAWADKATDVRKVGEVVNAFKTHENQ